ncbi:DMT family transporter [Pseudooceanicola algae]|uniref:Riboflavin transporter n=1 Tax=Pseudooceanicola algae TaxID=1537215 RepID=A0A418SC35_9RHOB|nr:DMT family transporter [Pseudooceanicola algae]QPM89960.1 Riboflavin transporter [Pseudooceanicola algae]
MSNNARAILLMIIAILCYSSMDATAKSIAEDTNTIMALWARYAGSALVVIAITWRRLGKVARSRFPVMQLVRGAFLLGATASFFTGLQFLGLAENTAIMDLNPVLITLGAALFLGEKLGPRRIAAIAVALTGALIVIRPGSAVFSIHALLPMMAACCYAGFSLITRYMGDREDPWTSLLYGAGLGAILVTLLLPGSWEMPGPATAAKMVLLAALGTVAQMLLIRALSIGEAAMLAPFAYVGLINATFLGMVVFGEYPDLWTIVGALVIVAAGVYVWHRETRAGHKTALSAEAKTPPEGL